MLLWPFNKYPGTDYETFNWEWILKTVKEWVATMQAFKNDITAAWNAMRADWREFETSLTDDWHDFQDDMTSNWHDFQDDMTSDWQDFIDNTYKEQVTEILEDHPEWTTTVQDGAITEPKININFLKEIKNVYTTPEEYGAVGDGVTDDTAAIQAAFDSGKIVVFYPKTYLINDPIIINNWINREFYADAAEIRYTGNEYAFKFGKVINCNFHFGKVRADNGGGIAFYANDADTWSQYVNIYFEEFSCLTDCVYAECGDTTRWINEIRLILGRFAKGLYGVRHKNNNTSGEGHISSWRFDRVGFEGVTNGFFIDSAIPNGGHSFIDCRYSESFSKLISANATCKDILWIGNQTLESRFLDLAGDSRGIVISKFATSGAFYLSGAYATIVKGHLVKSNSTDYLLVPSTYTDNTYDLSTLDSLTAPARLSINSTNVSNLILPSYYGEKNGFNEFVFSFAHVVSENDPFTVTKNGNVIARFTTSTGSRIHAKYYDSTGWQFDRLTSV